MYLLNSTHSQVINYNSIPPYFYFIVVEQKVLNHNMQLKKAKISISNKTIISEDYSLGVRYILKSNYL